jgi:PIN domain
VAEQTMNLFIDTNIYLTFYHYSSDDLEELKKLAVAIKSGEITLYSTQQIQDEFKRNRESKIADALKRFNEQKLGTQVSTNLQGLRRVQGLKGRRVSLRPIQRENFGKAIDRCKGEQLGCRQDHFGAFCENQNF